MAREDFPIDRRTCCNQLTVAVVYHEDLDEDVGLVLDGDGREVDDALEGVAVAHVHGVLPVGLAGDLGQGDHRVAVVGARLFTGQGCQVTSVSVKPGALKYLTFAGFFLIKFLIINFWLENLKKMFFEICFFFFLMTH